MFVGKRIQIRKDVPNYGGKQGVIRKEMRRNTEDPSTLGRGELWLILLDGDEKNLQFYDDQLEALPLTEFTCPFCQREIKVTDNKLNSHEYSESGLIRVCEGSFIPVECHWRK